MKPTAEVESPFFTAPQLAAYLHVSPDVLYKWRRNGEGPPLCQVVARRYLYRKTDVEVWLVNKQRQRKKVIPFPKSRRRKPA